MLPEGCDALVEPGADAYTELLGALMDAQPGQTVCMSEGTFNFVDELSISGDGVTLRGAGRDKTILDFSGQTVGANGVKITGDDVKPFEIGNPLRCELQRDIAQLHPLDLGRVAVGPARMGLLRPQPITHARAEPAGPPGPLIGRRL